MAVVMPRIPHAMIAGNRMMLIESVAWPPGHYMAMATGQIHCDGIYTGQSVRPLIAAVRHWREILSADHRVSALVIVHPITEGQLALPAATAGELAWLRADDAVRKIRACLARERPTLSTRAVAALVAATAENDEPG